jgi:hypothetical protein
MKTTKAKRRKVEADAPPKKVVQRLGRFGDEFAWVDKMLIDWGDGKLRET